MAGIKSELREGVTSSMRDRVTRVDVPASGPTGRPSLDRQADGRRRLDSACVIRVDRIAADANQPRTEFDPDALARLAESMKARGQLQPIRVRWDEGQGSYVVVVGERRWRAAKVAGLETLACVVVSGDATAEDLMEDQLVENALREDLRPIEQAKAFRALLAGRGLTQRQLADRLQVGQGTISKALALLSLPEGIQHSVDAGEIGPDAAYQISKVADPGEQANIARGAAKGAMKRDEIRAKTSKPKSKGKGRKVAPEPRRFRRARVSLAPGELTLVEAVSALVDVTYAVFEKWPKESVRVLGIKLIDLGHEVLDSGEIAC